MRANPADYDLIAPGSLAAVLTLLSNEPNTWTPIAGGTELMVQFAAGRLQPRKFVSIHALSELTQIAISPGEITIGAGVTYTTLRNHAEIARDLPLLATAASWTGSLANQNRGTLGGNLVNASPAADSPPALLAYAADLSLISLRGTRRIPYADFHTAYKQTALAPDELVLAVHIPRARYTHQYIRKVGPRNAQAISKVALAAVATLTGGILTDTRIALASVSHAPFRCRNTEAALLNTTLTPATIAAACAALLAEIAPLDDIRSTARYRAQVSANLLEEFLKGCPMIADAPTAARSPEVIVGSVSSALDAFNQASSEEAIHQLLNLCGCRHWAESLAAQRPYATAQSLHQAAEARWFTLTESDWLEAFAHHPRIGERPAATSSYLASSTAEQSRTQQTLAVVADQLFQQNLLYEVRLGFRYIVFANNRTAPELLDLLNIRLTHTREEELQEAARQQHLITALRMTKWLQPLAKTGPEKVT